ncbi:MAG: hypothetical protein PHE33_01925 [Bacteroidales bacterium]|nr:hypothetical protein [Bacteroidales bacterium]
MKKQEYKDNHDDNIISGVHNYCDRWCERCKFIKRCRVGLAELKRLERDGDMDDTDFLEEFSSILTDTFELVSKKAAEMGIDLNDLMDNSHEKTEKTPNEIEEIAKNYGIEAHNWTKNNSEQINKLTLKVIEQELAIPDFTEAFEVINWFEFFISVKIRRAFLGYQSEDDFETDDSNGSAKIALIAIDRSIEAYLVLYHQFPEYEDDILSLLKQLSQIKKQMLITFPDAMSFKRPGFDE